MDARPLVALVALVALAPARVATAQTAPPGALAAPSPQDAAEAKRKFAAGLKLYGEHAYVEALVEFEGSYRLGGRPSALRNVAQCHRDLRHFADAYEAYARLIEAHRAQLSKGDVEAVSHAIEELSDLSGSVKVTSDEADVEVDLDGKTLGRTPLVAAKRVSLGAHTVKARKAGFEPFERTITTQSNESVDVRVALVPEVQTGHLRVKELAGRAVEVFVDGTDRGPAPWEGDLPAGEHAVEARGPKLAAERRVVAVARREVLDVALEATTTVGRLRITTAPASATISVDGEVVATGVWDADVSPGHHHVEVRSSGGEPAMREVSVERGQSVALDVPVGAAAGAVTDYRGVYVRLNALGYASPTKTNLYAVDASDGFHFALGGDLRIGYSFGVLGIELTGQLMVDHYSVTATAYPSGSGGVTGVDGFVGLGARVTSHGETVRFTGGLSPGVGIHHVSVDDGSGNNGGATCSMQQLNPCGASSSNASGGYVAPGLLLDGGMLVGSSPGTKFFLGVQAMLELPPTLYVGPDVPSALPSNFFFSGFALKAVSGPQVYLGPVLGVQWGH